MFCLSFATPLALSVFLLGANSHPAPAQSTAQTPKPPIDIATNAGSPVSAAIAAAHKAELIAKVRELGGTDQWPSRVVDEIMTFKLSEAGWQLLLSDKGVKVAFGAARDVNDYAKRIGLGDLEAVESANSNARAANQADVGELLAKFKPQIMLTFEATQPVISPISASLILRAFATVPEHMDRGVWKPAGGRAIIRLALSPDAKDVTILINPDKTSFSIITPSKVEIPGWSTKIEKGLDRGK